MAIIVSGDDSGGRDRLWKVAKVAGAAVLGAAAVVAVGRWVARDQMDRHKRDLFSPHPLRRLAALGWLKKHPDVDNVLLLRDYVAWEERPLLRKRAANVLEAMEDELVEEARTAEGA